MHHVLDEPGFVTRLDPKGMFALAEGFPDQCRRALEIAQAAEIAELQSEPRVAVLTGMGGSAAGGDLVRALFESQGSLPFVVNRDYVLPHYIGLGDLVFCASYSGNTEETLSAYALAKKAGAQIVAITSGGKLAELARVDGFTVIQIPGGQPPRTALGFMCMPVLFCCERFKLIPGQDYQALFSVLDECAKQWGKDVPFEKNLAKQIAAELHGKLPVLYGLGSYQTIVANRWRGQLNENAKNLAFVNGFPELNHNEILGWVKASGQGVANWVGILLEDGTETDKMKARSRVTQDLISSHIKFFPVQALGKGLLERIFTLTYFGDFLSLYLAALNEVDPENIDSIDRLKAELSKIS